MIEQAIILAAGKGTRMLDLTQDKAKPMIEVAGRSLVYRIMDMLLEYGIKKIVINSFYKAEKLEKYVRNYDRDIRGISIELVREKELLETGGGIINMLPHLSSKPFFVINGDALWYGENIFSYLNDVWSSKMKALFLLFDKSHVLGYRGSGDFALGKQNKIINSGVKDYVYAGVHIVDPDVFNGVGVQVLKLMSLYNSLRHFQNMYGTVLPNTYFLHVGDRKAYDEAEQFLRDK